MPEPLAYGRARHLTRWRRRVRLVAVFLMSAVLLTTAVEVALWSTTVRISVDLSSGDVRRQRCVFGFPVWASVSPTEFSELVHKHALTGQQRNWALADERHWSLAGRYTDHHVYGFAISQCKLAAQMLESANMSETEERAVVAKYLDLLKRGDKEAFRNSLQSDWDALLPHEKTPAGAETGVGSRGH